MAALPPLPKIRVFFPALCTFLSKSATSASFSTVSSFG